MHPHRFKEVLSIVRKRVNGDKVERMTPSWEGFKGPVMRDSKGMVVVKGNWELKNAGYLLITEIPPNRSIQEYKAFL